MSKQSLQILTLRQVPTTLQVIDTLKNLQKISPIDIEAKQFKSEIKKYAQQYMALYKQSTTQQGQQKYICFLKQQQIDEEYYISHYHEETFKLDPLNSLIIQRKKTQNKLSQSHLKLIKFLKQKIQLYLDQHFSKPYGSTCHLKINQNNNLESIIIGFTNKNYNISNFYSGEWVSRWIFTKDQYEANINIRNHYFQNGNIVFQRNKPIKSQVQNFDFTDINCPSQQLVDRITSTIKREEKYFQNQLQNLFKQKINKSLKKIRRISPITQGKMIWNVNAVLLSKNLAETQQQEN